MAEVTFSGASGVSMPLLLAAVMEEVKNGTITTAVRNPDGFDFFIDEFPDLLSITGRTLSVRIKDSAIRRLEGEIDTVKLDFGTAEVEFSGFALDAKRVEPFLTAKDFSGLLDLLLARNDNIEGTNAADHILGGGGEDRLGGNGGDDTLDGGAGRDVAYAEAGNDRVFGGAGDDQLYGGTGDDSVFGDAGKDLLIGEVGDDSLEGGAGKDRLDGRGDDDTLSGGVGDDSLVGGAGNDILIGGAGKDALTGGDGEDVFVFTFADIANNADRIADFKTGVDAIGMMGAPEDLFDANGVLLEQHFTASAFATTADHRFLYDQAKGLLFYDADGFIAGGSAAKVLIATLTDKADIEFSDIIRMADSVLG